MKDVLLSIKNMAQGLPRLNAISTWKGHRKKKFSVL